MNIALIQPPHNYDGGINCLPTFQIGLGILSIKDFLKKHGYNVRIFHLPWVFYEGITYEYAFQKIVEFDPGICGIALNWLHFSEGAIETAKRLKTLLPNTIIVLGGQHASLFSEEIMQQHSDVIDVLLQGEAEMTMLAVVQSVEETHQVKTNIPGLVYRDEDSIIRISQPEVVNSLDELPFFFIDDVWPEFTSKFIGLPQEFLSTLQGFRTRAALDTVRGVCPKNCSYCIASHIGAVQGRSNLAAHSTQWLAEHIKLLVERGISSITVQDPFFTLGDAALTELTQGILERGLNEKLLSFDIFVEPGAYSVEAMKYFSQVAAIVTIEFGVETGSPKVAKTMGRNDDFNAMLENMIGARKAGLIPISWWMVNLPNEGSKEIEETLDFISETMNEGIIPAQVSPMVLFPQTALAAFCDKFGIKKRLKTFEDFKRFSRCNYDDKSGARYPELLTHSSDIQSNEDTMNFHKQIQDQFAKNWCRLEERYQTQPTATVVQLLKQLTTFRFY